MGLLALFTMCFAAITSSLVLLALFPPPGQGIAGLMEVAAEVPLRFGLRATVWVAGATLVFWVEQTARPEPSTRS